MYTNMNELASGHKGMKIGFKSDILVVGREGKLNLPWYCCFYLMT
jgi:hypothetical protein